MKIKQIADDVWFVERDGVWSYMSRWGNIDNAWAFVKAHCKHFVNHRLSDEDIESAGFAGLYEAMVEYTGPRSIEAYASYHTFRALRRHVEQFVYMRLGEPYLMMRAYSRFTVVHHWPKELTEAELGRSLDRYPPAIQSVDRSHFWTEAERVALTCGTKPKRDWDIMKQLCSGERAVILGQELGLHRCSVGKVRRVLGRRMRKKWTLREATVLIE